MQPECNRNATGMQPSQSRIIQKIPIFDLFYKINTKLSYKMILYYFFLKLL